MEINFKVVKVLEDSAPTKARICRWALEFQRGRDRDASKMSPTQWPS